MELVYFWSFDIERERERERGKERGGEKRGFNLYFENLEDTYWEREGGKKKGFHLYFENLEDSYWERERERGKKKGFHLYFENLEDSYWEREREREREGGRKKVLTCTSKMWWIHSDYIEIKSLFKGYLLSKISRANSAKLISILDSEPIKYPKYASRILGN